jgi:Xaa-Pro aminopeptidase
MCDGTDPVSNSNRPTSVPFPWSTWPMMARFWCGLSLVMNRARGRRTSQYYGLWNRNQFRRDIRPVGRSDGLFGRRTFPTWGFAATTRAVAVSYPGVERPDMADFLDDRRERLDSYLDDRGLDAVWFARPNGFKWLAGGDNVVDREGDTGVAAVGYVRKGDAGGPERNGDGNAGSGSLRVVTNNIEADRLRDEELPDAFAVETFDWYDGSLPEAVADRSPGAVVADFAVPGADDVDATALRTPLSESDVAVYRQLGRETAAAVESVARELEPDDTELEAASALRIALSSRGIEAPVVLAGGSERAQAYRHYIPTRSELGDYALLSVTAERDGLHASTTRTVAFDEPDWLEARTEAAMRVAATALGATRTVAASDGVAGDVFEYVRDAYEAVGYEGEWRHHHQGGAAGFAGREWIATPDHPGDVTTPMAYAWNPTVQGAKSEDTVLVTEDGLEVLTWTDSWPTRTVESVADDAPATLDCHDVLRR